MILIMLKIAMLSPLPPQKMGESEYTASLIEKLSTYRIWILAITGYDADPLTLPNVETACIWNGRQVTYPFRVMQYLKKNRPHILHVQFGPDGSVYGGMFGEIMLFLLILVRMMGIKTTVTLHSTWMPEQVVTRVKTYRRLGRFAIFAAPLFRLYMKLLDWGTDTIQLSTVKIGSTLRKRFLKKYRIKEEKVLEIPHPCKLVKNLPDSKLAQKELGLTDRTPLLLFGFLRRGKGIDIAIQAQKLIRQKHPSTILLIAGYPLGRDGKQYLQEARQLVQKLGVEDVVRFDTRFIPSQQIPLYFASAKILLLPYEESVGASGPAHNYAGYGIPIVAADVGLHTKEALDGNVILFKNRNPSDLAQKVSELLNNQKKYTEISNALRAYASRENWDLAAIRTVKYYKTTLKK